MKILKRLSIVLLLLTVCTLNTYAKNGPSRNGGGQHQGPPPEAYTACEDKSVGDTAEFVNPHGDTVTGTCEEVDDKLALKPDNPRR